MPKTPSASDVPAHVTVHGLHKVCLTAERGGTFEQVMPNTETFSSLVVAINIGLEMLESPAGRHALANLGQAVIARRDYPSFNFTGEPARMSEYVDHFLRRVRHDFPLLALVDFKESKIVAVSDRGAWNGRLDNYQPKKGGFISYNSRRVKAMVDAYEAQWAAKSGSSDQRRYLERWQTFLFLFACATLHELGHLFLGYLALGNDFFTPPEVTYLSYGSAIRVGRATVLIGESGRWLESVLYGGALEFYRDPNQGRGQAGIPHILDRQATAYRIKQQSLLQFLRSPRRYTFPFEVAEDGLTTEDRRRLRLEEAGVTVSGTPTPPNARTMRAMEVMTGFRTFSIGEDLLRERATRPNVQLAVQARS